MAKRHGRKSDAIREILAAQPTATVKEIQSALAAKRIKASVALISKLKAGKRPRRKPARNGHTNGVAFEHLLAAKGLVARVGSISTAKEALDALAMLAE